MKQGFQSGVEEMMMKAALLLLASVLGSVYAFGQDDAAAMAMQQAQQASQQAMQAAQQASQQASQDMQQAMQNAQQNSGPVIAITRTPNFSVKAGEVAPGTTVRIKCPTHYAAIYYTTNGWSPTTASRRYTAPIPINATMQLQAIAVAPNLANSLIARANYTVDGTSKPVLPLTLSADGALPAKTRLQLVTNSAVSSKTAEIGDAIGLLLDQDIKIGDAVVVPKGTPVDATITQADPSGHVGRPGDIAFEVYALTARGIRIPLQGGETLEGASHYGTVKGLAGIPAIGVFGLLVRGDEAEIKPGMTFTVAVAADTQLKP